MKSLQDHHEDLIEGLARVVAVDAAQVWLAAERPAACLSCATRSACGNGTALPSASWHVSRLLGPNQTPLALGERVHIGVDRHALTRASLAAYAFPLATMLIAVVAMQDAGDAAAIAAAMVGLLVGVAAAKVLVRRWSNALVPVVLGRALTPTGSSCAPASTAVLRVIDIPVIHHRSQ
jgi:sigma-E factor negative regulatory protein RseC